jgi:pimeloyl-ACP methyl ester carboxylesterase
MNPILLLHGALGSKTQLDPLKSALEKQGRAVFLINFSGHSGEPFARGFGIESFSDDISNFIKQNSISKVDIFGYSMGGYVAIWYAKENPDNVGKIVTLGTKFDWDPASAEKETRKLNPEKMEEKVPAFARILQHRHAPNDWKELLKRTADMMLGLGGKPLLTETILKSLTNEVEILLGDQDDMADRAYSQKVSELIPNASFELLTNTPHPIEKVDLRLITSRFKLM